MAKQSRMNRKVKVFLAANAANGITSGTVHGPQGGVTYTLKGGARFDLTATECRAIAAAGGVRWHGIKASAQ